MSDFHIINLSFKSDFILMNFCYQGKRDDMPIKNPEIFFPSIDFNSISLTGMIIFVKNGLKVTEGCCNLGQTIVLVLFDLQAQ